jgi:hypothetical protein
MFQIRIHTGERRGHERPPLVIMSGQDPQRMRPYDDGGLSKPCVLPTPPPLPASTCQVFCNISE